jgi:hypothetical protein
MNISTQNLCSKLNFNYWSNSDEGDLYTRYKFVGDRVSISSYLSFQIADAKKKYYELDDSLP